MRDKGTSTRESFTESIRSKVKKGRPVTEEAEQKARATGKLHPLVDPAGYGVIRRSLPRFVQLDSGYWRMAVGLPVPSETRLDTTGSMGDNLDIAMHVLPESYGLCSSVLSGCDLQVSIGIFGDVQDQFVLCRPQFEMDAEKIVEQMTLQVPDRAGGDIPEDPHYGMFGAAYLTDTYISRVGLKGYDFTVSDACARDFLDERQLVRIYGPEVFQKVRENGHDISGKNLPSTAEVLQDLLKRAHAFFLQVGVNDSTTRFWTRIFGRERVVIVPRTELLPQIQAAVIGLTEGVIGLAEVEDFLRENNVNKTDAKKITRSVAGIPIGAQAALPNYYRRPKAGDIYREKTDLWPLDPGELKDIDLPEGDDGGAGGGVDWL